MGRHTYLLDGDNVRHGLNKDLGFTDADRVENIRRVAEVAQADGRCRPDRADRVHLAVPRPSARWRASCCGEGEFIEVFVDTPLAVAEQRDVKGLYKKARRGELKNFTGIDSPYERPENPALGRGHHARDAGAGGRRRSSSCCARAATFRPEVARARRRHGPTARARHARAAGWPRPRPRPHRQDHAVDARAHEAAAGARRRIDAGAAGARDVEELGAASARVERQVQQRRQADVAARLVEEGLVGGPPHRMHDGHARQLAVQPVDVLPADDLEHHARILVLHLLDHRMQPADLGAMRGAAVIEDPAGARCPRAAAAGPRAQGSQAAYFCCSQAVDTQSCASCCAAASPRAACRLPVQLVAIAPGHVAPGERIEDVVVHEEDQSAPSARALGSTLRRHAAGCSARTPPPRSASWPAGGASSKRQRCRRRPCPRRRASTK